MGLKQQQLLLIAPNVFVDVRVEVVVPSFPALLARPLDLLVLELQPTRHCCPIVETHLGHDLLQHYVFLNGGGNTFLDQFFLMREL